MRRRSSPFRPLVALPSLTLLALASMTGARLVQAENVAYPIGTDRSFKTDVLPGGEIGFLLHVPEGADQKLPLIVFLHGSGERGDDLERVKVHGPPKRIEAGDEMPFIVLSPQCPSGQRWTPELVIGLLDHVRTLAPVDDDRIYLTGLSMGGFGTWATACAHPGRFAAIAPICGGGDPAQAYRLKGLPIWNFHGGKDTAVPIGRSESMVAALRRVDCELNYTVYPEAGHDSWTETYDNPKLYKWFLECRRSERGDRVTELAIAAPESVGVSSVTLREIDEVVNSFIERDEIAGAVVGVVRNGKVVRQSAHGLADRESQQPMRLDTIFRIYSMSKPITSVAVMMLVEAGKIDLDRPVAEYLPVLAGLRVYQEDGEPVVPARAMTTRDLLRHTAGLTYGFLGDSPVSKLYREKEVLGEESLEAFVEKLGSLPLAFSPGERWHYSVSVDVLGRLVEVVAEEPFDRFLDERVFGPLDMRDTGFFVPADRLERFSSVYSPRADGGLQVSDAMKSSRFARKPGLASGGGGLVSTLRDYLRFGQMLVDRGTLDGVRVLARETVDEMTRNQLSAEVFPIRFGEARREGVGFGLGVSVRVLESALEPAGRVGEYGWGGAASTQFWISPEDRLLVVALSQYMPYSDRLERAIKPIVYRAIDSIPAAR